METGTGGTAAPADSAAAPARGTAAFGLLRPTWVLRKRDNVAMYSKIRSRCASEFSEALGSGEFFLFMVYLYFYPFWRKLDCLLIEKEREKIFLARHAQVHTLPPPVLAAPTAHYAMPTHYQGCQYQLSNTFLHKPITSQFYTGSI